MSENDQTAARARANFGSMERVYYSVMESPVGPLTLRWAGAALIGLAFDSASIRARLRDWVRDDARLAPVRSQLDEFFRGERRTFDVPLAFAGTAFQQSVWHALSEIPFGATTSYGELAQHVGRPKYPGAQEVGVALNKNPIAVIAPCHRVIGANGSLIGFGGGLDRKRWLLTHEGSATASTSDTPDATAAQTNLFDRNS